MVSPIFTKKTLLCLFIVLPITVQANVINEDLDDVIDKPLDGLTIEGGVTLTAMGTTFDGVDNEWFGSADFIATLPVSTGYWSIYIEAEANPDEQGIGALLPDANGDIGSALDEAGHGRIQLSEWHYRWPTLGGTMTIGLMDAAGFVDTSEIANDEASQFIGASFINNPTIALPDYSLGLAYHTHSAHRQTGLTALLVSSHGLGDNPGVSYAELFKVGEGDKGFFAVLEGYQLFGDITARVGLWASSADDEKLAASISEDVAHNLAHNYGLYASIDGMGEQVSWNIRAGIANDEVSEATRFLSVAAQLAQGENIVGIAVAHTWASNEFDGDDFTQAEFYYQWQIDEQFALTPSVQYLKDDQEDGVVYGVRLGWGF